MHSLRRLTIITGTVAVVLLTATAAFAYWTVQGSGSGTATVATFKPLAISQVKATNLAPGRPRDLVGSVHNPNDFDVRLADHLPRATGSVDSKHGRCDFAANFELTQPTRYSSDVVQAHGTVKFWGGTIRLLDLPDVDQIDCQGVVVTLGYTLG